DDENYKAIGDEEVEQTHVSLSRSASLRKRVLDYHLGTLSRMVESRGGQASAPATQVTVDAVARDRRRWKQQTIHHPDVRDVPVNLSRCVRQIHSCKAANFSRS